jgi:hypothetical protein
MLVRSRTSMKVCATALCLQLATSVRCTQSHVARFANSASTLRLSRSRQPVRESCRRYTLGVASSADASLVRGFCAFSCLCLRLAAHPRFPTLLSDKSEESVGELVFEGRTASLSRSQANGGARPTERSYERFRSAADSCKYRLLDTTGAVASATRGIEPHEVVQALPSTVHRISAKLVATNELARRIYPRRSLSHRSAVG